jgi:hypothetical protein
MTPEQKLKCVVINLLLKWRKVPLLPFSPDTADSAWQSALEDDNFFDAMNEVRSGGKPTDLYTEGYEGYERDYDGKEVARQMPDGSWVGWTYWSGGGHHGEPGVVPWLGQAYNVTCKEELRLVLAFGKAD